MTGPARFQLLPPLRAGERAELRASIAKSGIIDPIVLDEDGAIIDGHHRAAIAAELGIDAPTQVAAGLSEAGKRIMAARLNAARRRLTNEQRSLLAEKIAPDIAAEARRNQLAGLHSQPGDPSLPPRRDNEKRYQRTTDYQAAKAVGIGANTFYRHKQVFAQARKDAPDLMPFIEAGDLTIADVKRELKARAPQPPPPAPAGKRPPPRPLAPAAKVPPEVRRVAGVVQDAIERVRLLRSQHEIGRLVLGPEGEIFALELRTLRDELAAFADEITAAEERQRQGGTRRHDHLSR